MEGLKAIQVQKEAGCVLAGTERTGIWSRASVTTQPLGVSHRLFLELAAHYRFLGKFCCRDISILLLGSGPVSGERKALPNLSFSQNPDRPWSRAGCEAPCVTWPFQELGETA